MRKKARRRRSQPARRAKTRRRSARRKPPTRLGSWPTALTEARSASRHLAEALAAQARLASELATLRRSVSAVARLELARELTAGPDGGPLALLSGLAASTDPPEAAPFARAARLLLERLCAALGLTPSHAVGERVTIAPETMGDYEWLAGTDGVSVGERVIVRPGWRLGDRVLVRPMIAPA